jgi:hypothetical protein
VSESTWSPRDLNAAWDGEQIPPPDLCRLDDGFGLFYRARINGIHGEPECGKSWVAWIAVAQLLAGKGRALYLDYEDSEHGAAQRLAALGVPRNVAIGPRFGYLRPEEPLGANGTGNYREWCNLLGMGWDLIVVDSHGEAMTLEGLDPSDNKEAAIFARRLARPAIESGAAILLLDHVTKSRETRGTWAIGAQQKRAMIRGASYLVTNKRPFGRGLEGEATLTVAKDTPGAIRQRTGGDPHVARLTLISDGLTGQIHYRLTVPPTPHALVLDRVRAYLIVNQGASKRALRSLSNSDIIDEVIARAVGDGQIKVEVTGTVHAHFWIEQEIDQ